MREEARAILERGFGDAPLQAVKDPRFCLTLGFWLAAAESCELPVTVLVISRSPLEVAASLQKRDGFPPGYGLRLYVAYRRMLAAQAPPGALYLSYDELLRDPAGVMERLASAVPLNSGEVAFDAVVRGDLRHQSADSEQSLLARPGGAGEDLDGLLQAIEDGYPAAQSAGELARAMVDRGQQLTELGEAHSEALATLDQRDRDVEGLAGELREAVATIAERDRQIAELDRRLESAGSELEHAMATVDERDAQIREFDRRLAEIGQMHSEALALIEARDAQLQRVFDKPGVGLLFKAMWSRESR